MTLDETIKHEEKLVSEYEQMEKERVIDGYEMYFLEYHQKLAEWLKDYRRLLECNK